MDLNKDVESPCELTPDWGFVGYIQKYGPKSEEIAVPIGVYGCYADGVAHANAWMRSDDRAVRWEGQRLYKPITSPEGAEA